MLEHSDAATATDANRKTDTKLISMCIHIYTLKCIITTIYIYVYMNKDVLLHSKIKYIICLTYKS